MENQKQEVKISEFAMSQLRKAVDKWRKQGHPIVSEETYSMRRSICEKCEFWNSESLQGIGICKHCGCSGMILWHGNEFCQLHKWEKST